jgi:hypothetical protein
LFYADGNFQYFPSATLGPTQQVGPGGTGPTDRNIQFTSRGPLGDDRLTFNQGTTEEGSANWDVGGSHEARYFGNELYLNMLNPNGSVAISATNTMSPVIDFYPLGSALPVTLEADLFTGKAATATALAADGTNCSSGQPALGVDASGNAQGCAAITGAQLSMADVTTNNVTSTVHGFAPKSPGDATQFLNGAATPAYAQVTDANLSTSDITTNNATTSKHGFLPKLPNSAGAWLDGTGAFTQPSRSYQCVLNGNGSVIATGDTLCYDTSGPNSGSINRIDILGYGVAGATCSVTLDVWKAAGAFPTSGNKISSSAPITLSTANVAANGSRTSWTAGVSAGDIFDLNVASVTGCIYVQAKVWYQ